MACSPTNLSAYTRGCKNVGGVKQFWYWLKSQRISQEIEIVNTAGVATIVAGSGKVDAYQITPEQDNWNITQPISDNNTQGTSFITQNLQGNLMGYSPAIAALMDDLRKARYEALVELENGELVFLGLSSRGLQTEGGDAGFSGTTLADPLGVNIILTSQSRESAPVLATFAEFLVDFDVTEAA